MRPSRYGEHPPPRDGIVNTLVKNTGPEELVHRAVMALVVGLMSLVAEKLWLVIPASPYFTSATALMVTAACIFFGAWIAFLMIWVEFSVIQETSALTFMVAGTFKEIVTGPPPPHHTHTFSCYLTQLCGQSLVNV